MSRPRVYVVVLNWNGFADTAACLESLLSLEYDALRVVVVDNGSTDGTVSRLSRWAAERGITAAVASADDAEALATEARIVILDVGENLGFAGGNNVGLRFALARGDFDYAWILNNDTVVEPKSLGYLVDKMESTGAGIGGPTLVSFDERDHAQALGGATYDPWFARPRQLGAAWRSGMTVDEDALARQFAYVAGAAMLVSKPFLEDVGLMDPSFFLYFEELDWAARARGKWKLAYASRSVVYHKEGASTGTASETSEYYYARARLLFTRKYHRRALPTACFALATRALDRAVHGEGKLARAIVVAALDGLRGKTGIRR